jgi:hypothetical protein
MATQCSFDITSTVDLQEVDNALNQARKEVAQRYDFKGARAEIEFNRGEKTLTLTADDRMKLDALWEIVQTRLVRRQVPVKNLKPGDPEPAAGGTAAARGHAAAGHLDRGRQGDREVPEGPEAEEGAGTGPGRPGARHRPGAGRTAGGHPTAARQGLRRGAAVRETIDPDALLHLLLLPLDGGAFIRRERENGVRQAVGTPLERQLAPRSRSPPATSS